MLDVDASLKKYLQIDRPLKDLLFSFKGRISRREFWVFFGPVIVVFGILDTIAPEVGPLILGAIIFWPFLAVSVKRWHDRDKSAWWTLIILVPLIGVFWWWIECGFLAGTEGDNRFGVSSNR